MKGKRSIVFALGIILLIFLSMNSFINHFNTKNSIPCLQHTSDNSNNFIKNLKTDSLSSDGILDGIGAPWNVSHYANHTEQNSASFSNNSYQLVSIKSGYGWTGYKLNATLNHIYDKRQWINGTMAYGADDGTYNANENDTSDIKDWSFHEVDTGSSNDMSGNYYDNAAPLSGNQDCLELRMDGRFVDATHRAYDANDRCYWEYSTNIPRGHIKDSIFSFQVRPLNLSQVNSWVVRVYINNIRIYSLDIIALRDIGLNTWGTVNLPQSIWTNTSNVFPDILNSSNINIRVSLEHISSVTVTYGPEDGPGIWYQRVLIDNIELTVNAEVLPSQINLKMNGTNVIDKGFGKGTIELYGNWNGTKNPYVYANFSSQGSGDYGGYIIQFNTLMNLYAHKKNQPTTYATDASYKGTHFSVKNNSLVYWECYSFIAEPTGYKETLMQIKFPTDINITWISSAQQPSVNVLNQCDNSTAGLLIIPVDIISGTSTPNGFWKIEAKSPNYLENVNIYSNASGTWVPSNQFISGEYINITAKLVNSPLITGELINTKAQLNIIFPNGTIWKAKQEYKSPDNNGYIYFTPFKIPDTIPNYEIGTYKVIITWNNSYSAFQLNKSGLISDTFTVIHYSKLTPEKTIYENVWEDSVINIKVSFNDKENDEAIENAQVYLYNFTDPATKNFLSEISPGLYLIEFNVSGAEAGNNTITIYANSSLYINNKVNITVFVIKETELNAKEFPSLKVYWNQNFSIHFNYTEKTTGQGIITTPIIHWIGEYHTTMIQPGIYILECNSSAYEVNKIYTLLIEINQTGYQTQSVLIKIEILERTTYLNNIFLNGINKTNEKAITLTSGALLNITVMYNDALLTSNNFITNASVNLISDVINKKFNENKNQKYYSISINTTEIGTGVKFLTISAQKQNYQSVSEVLTVTINKRGTYYNLFLNGINCTEGGTFEVEIDTNINITVTYKDLLTHQSLRDAIVNLTGIGALDQHPVLPQYNITINSNNLTIGVNILTLYLVKDGYEPLSPKFSIIVSKRKTNLILFLNGINKTSTPSIDIPYGATLNITVRFTDFHNGIHISGASILIEGGGLSDNLTENAALGQYTFILGSKVFDIGVRFITIYARKDAYEEQSILVRINVRRIHGELSTESGSNTFNIRPQESIELIIILTDKDFNKVVSGATVKYTWEFGQGELKEIEKGKYKTIIENVPEGSHIITITVYAGDDYEFEKLEIKVNAYIPAEEAFIWNIIMIGALIAAGAIASYVIAYQKVLKYPKPVRKVRLFRKKFDKKKFDKYEILSKEEAIKTLYIQELGTIQKGIKAKHKELSIKEKEQFKKNNK
ncbi:MAG: hypothetical protein ACP6IY_14190 [Promethearchaeia archaeon]